MAKLNPQNLKLNTNSKLNTQNSTLFSVIYKDV